MSGNKLQHVLGGGTDGALDCDCVQASAFRSTFEFCVRGQASKWCFRVVVTTQSGSDTHSTIGKPRPVFN